MLRDDLLEKHKVRQVNTAWNDSYPIDWDWMQKGLNETMSKADQNCSFHWFLIDEITHGSVTTFPSKEIFESMRARRESHRNEPNNEGITMIYEVVGHLKAEGSSQP